MFQCLEEFKGKHGHCNVPTSSATRGKLGVWVKDQRAKFRDKLLEQERIEKLESIGFVWRLRPFRELQSDILEERWEERYQQLLLYKEENGDCNVRFSFDDSDDSFPAWVNTQRKWNHHGTLRADRKKRLVEIGFTWTFQEIYDEAWISMFNELKDLKEQFGGMDGLVENIKGRETWASYASSSSSSLYFWEKTQQNKMLRGTLQIDREIMLREIGYWESLNLHKSEPSK